MKSHPVHRCTIYVTSALIFHVGNILSMQNDLMTLCFFMFQIQKILSRLKLMLHDAWSYEIGRKWHSIDNELNR